MTFRCRLLAVLAGLAFITPTLAQNTDGETLGSELLEGFSMPAHDADGGARGEGTVTIGETQINVGQLVPGADRAAVDRFQSFAKDGAAAEAAGIAAFDDGARSQHTQGDVFRTIIDSPPPRISDAADPEIIATLTQTLSDARATGLAGVFSDCTNDLTITPQAPIQTFKDVEHTCAIGYQGATCQRTRQVTVEWVEEVVIDDSCDPNSPNYLGADQCPSEPPSVPPTKTVRTPVVSETFTNDRLCENDSLENGCDLRWRCTAPGPKTINGLLLDAQSISEFGLGALIPGEEELCFAATATPVCPICIEGDSGVLGCEYAEIDQSEGSSCEVLAARSDCRLSRRSCLLTDPDDAGVCSTEGHTYTCREPVTVATSSGSVTNACDSQIQCLNGECRSEEGAFGSDAQGDPMQLVLAQMTVAGTTTTDRTVGEGPGTGSGQPVPAPPEGIDEDNVAYQWGYDQDDTGGAGAEDDAPPTPPPATFSNIEVQLFKGDHLTCQKGFAGLIDCCKVPKTTAPTTYWNIHREVTRSVGGQNQLAEGQGQAGASDQMRSGQSSMSTLSSPFTSLQANVMGGGAGNFSDTTGTVHEQFMAKARTEIRPSLTPKWLCTEKEFDLAVQREVGVCSYAGTYCAKKVLGVCLKRRESYCCYKSPMSKMLRASVDGGEIRHGSAKNPDCDGIPIDRIGEIDWSVMDFNQLAGRMDQGGAFDGLQGGSDSLERLTGTGIGAANEGRVNAVDRTSSTLNDINIDGVRSAIESDAHSRVSFPEAQAQDEAARITFEAGYARVLAGRPYPLVVRRTGSLGAVTATVTIIQGAPDLIGFSSSTLTWSAGDTSRQTIVLQPPPGQHGEVLLELAVSGGEVGSNPIIQLDVRP